MVLDIPLRKAKDQAVSVFYFLIPKYRFHPNKITYLSGVFGVLSAYFAFQPDS